MNQEDVPNGVWDIAQEAIKNLNIVESIRSEVIQACEKYKEESEDHYDFYNEHIKYAYEEAIKLANIYHANVLIVSLGVLLHDIALIKNEGDKEKHHEIGAEIAEEMLKKYNLDPSIIERVKGCVYNHRKGINAHNDEEVCVSDGDIISHFKNIPMLFNTAYNRKHLNLNDARDWIYFCFKNDFNELSYKTKESFREEYNNICKVILGKIIEDE